MNRIDGKPFFTLDDGREAMLYSLALPEENLTVSISDFGCVIHAITLPGRDGKLRDVCLGFGAPADYRRNSPAFGAVIGRVANRIDRGEFELDGVTYSLTRNASGNALHGGRDGYQFRLWRAEAALADGLPELRLELTSPDGDQGFPGMLRIELVYRLRPGGELALSYRARCDRPTLVNLTNHCFFNLDGETSGDIFGHEFMLEADERTAVRPDLVPTGEIVPVAGTVYDLNTPVVLAERRALLANGFDDNFVLARGHRGRVRAAKSGIELGFVTDQPGVQIYTANFLDGSTAGKDGRPHGRFGGFCLEAQHFPDAPHHPDFPSIVLRPGEEYRQETGYTFTRCL